MNPKEIIKEKEKFYRQIKKAETGLEYIRSICKHEKTFVGDYSDRAGYCSPAEICEYCGELIKYISFI